MTKERFTIEKDNGLYRIFDNGKLIPILDGQPIVDLLNELNDENEELKQFKEQVKKELQESYELYVEATIVAPAVINNLAKRLGIDLDD